MKKITFIFTLFIALLGVNAQAQSTNPIEELPTESYVDSYRNFITFSPMYLFLGGIKLDYEYRFGSGMHGLVIAPTLYQSSSNNSSIVADDSESWGGLGINIGHKIYLVNELPKEDDYSSHVYFSHGPFYQKSNINYLGDTWESAEYDGLQIVELVNGKHTTTIDRYGYNFALGVQTTMDNRLVVDFYMGIGIRRAVYSYSSEEFSNGDYQFDEVWLSPGYQGTVFNLGFKIGIAL